MKKTTLEDIKKFLNNKPTFLDNSDIYSVLKMVTQVPIADIENNPMLFFRLMGDIITSVDESYEWLHPEKEPKYFIHFLYKLEASLTNVFLRRRIREMIAHFEWSKWDSEETRHYRRLSNVPNVENNATFLSGWLKAISSINNKVNHEYDFTLETFPKYDSLEQVLTVQFQDIFSSFEIQQVDTPMEHLPELINPWFFAFQEKHPGSHCLNDKQGAFALSHSMERQEWINEFTNLLLSIESEVKVYTLEQTETKGFYACQSTDIIIEGKEQIYHLHFSVSD